MAEPIGIAGSIVAVLQLSDKVVRYLGDIKDSSKDRQRLLIEIHSVTGLLYMLKERLERAGSETLSMIHSLNAPEGPVTQFRQALEELVPKLLPAEGWRKVGETLSWPFKKEEIIAILGRIERQKSLFSLALQNDHTALSEAIREDVASLSEGVDEIRMVQRDDAKDKVLRWLSSTNPSSNHDEARKKHEPSTGAWLLRSQFFSEWKQNGNTLLWLHGIPGCGKTILCSTIIEDIAKVDNDGVAYYYFDFNDTAKQHVGSFLRSVIAQLSQGAATLPNVVRKLYDQFHSNSADPGVEILLETLISVIHNHGPYFLLLDALDESERKDVLAILSRIVSRGLSNLHILVTSRKERDIEDVLAPIVTGTHSLSLDTTDVDADISLYVRQCLATDSKLRRWSDPVKAEIETSLTEGAHGMFRWVECQITTLRSCRTEALLRKALNQLPKTLDDTYDRILLNIPEEDKQMARTALLWLAFSERPLYLDEVAEAAILSPESCTLDPGDRLLDSHDMIDICAGLITSIPVTTTEWIGRPSTKVERERELLRFAHFSVKEYIISDRIAKGNASAFAMLESEAQTCLAQVCISYLLLFNDHELSSAEEVLANPLLEYAGEFWHKHASSKVALPASTISQMCSLFRPYEGASFLNWVRIHDVDATYSRSLLMEHELSNFASPLYYASLLGLPEVASSLVVEGADIDAECGTHGNALSAAAGGGHASVVQLLLSHGADYKVFAGIYRETALGVTAWQGHESVVRILMTKELGTEASRERIIEALRSAAVCGHEPIVRLIGNSEACCNLSGEDLHHPLASAARRGHVSVVQTLLSLGANVNPGEGRQQIGSPLQNAAQQGHDMIVQMLLDQGADVRSAGMGLDNALEAATSTGQVTVMRLLQAQGYDLSTMYNGALWIAAGAGHLASTQFLLDQGADVNAQGGEYGNALQAAGARGHKSVVQMLLEAGADVNAQGGKYGSALQAAARDYESVVQMLLEAGADVNAQGGKYGSALQAAARGYESVVQMLLEAGADVNAQGGEYGSALQAAVRGFESVVQMLLEAGADVNAQDDKYGSALQAAAARGYDSVGHMLLEAGADVNAQGGKYGSALQAAAAAATMELIRGDNSVADTLLSGFAEAAAVDQPFVRIVLLLLQAGAEVPPKLAANRAVQKASAILEQETTDFIGP